MIAMFLATVAALSTVSGAPQADTDDFIFDVTPIEAEQTMQSYADCLAESSKRRGAISAFLRTIPKTRAFVEQARALTEPSCMPRSRSQTKMTFRPLLLRPALYSALYRREFKSAPANITNRARLEYAQELDLEGRKAPDDFLYLRDLGDCTARAKPAEVRSLVMSAIGSKAEQATLTALMPTVRNCVSQGSTLRFSRTMLRGTFAESVYKLSTAPVASPAS